MRRGRNRAAASDTVTKPSALATATRVGLSPPPPAAAKPRTARDDDVLEDEDREDEIGLVVREAPEVDQPLDDHRARGDVDAGGKDERREREPERDHTDDQADGGVDRQVDGPAEPDMASASQQALEAELEAEEEEQERDAELGDEGRHLGRLDEAQEGRLVRAEQQSGQQVGGNRGEPEAPGQQAQPGEHRDRDGKLSEGERRFGERQGALILRQSRD